MLTYSTTFLICISLKTLSFRKTLPRRWIFPGFHMEEKMLGSTSDYEGHSYSELMMVLLPLHSLFVVFYFVHVFKGHLLNIQRAPIRE